MHAHAKRRLGVDWHGTTADGAVTLEPVFCLGLCACGPAALLDGEPLARLDAAALDDRSGRGAGMTTIYRARRTPWPLALGADRVAAALGA